MHSARRDLIAPVLAFAERHRWLPPGQRVLVACSGGLDSTVLLDLLVRIAPRRGLSLRVAHVDHGARPGSAEDARFVADFCADRGVECVSRRLDAAALVAAGSPEEKLRRARLSILDDEARGWGAGAVAFGHHADDRAEWLLMRLLQGVPADGWFMVPGHGLTIRPLFETFRAQLFAYATMRGLEWREDSTNADMGIPRNRIRHEIIPWLEERSNPSLRAALIHLEAEAREDAAELDRPTREALRALTTPHDDRALAVVGLASLSEALRRRVLGRWLYDVLGLEPRRSLIRDLAAWVERGDESSPPLPLSDGWTAYRSAGFLTASRTRDALGS